MMMQNPVTIDLVEVGEKAKEKYNEQSMKWSTQELITALEICNQADINYKTSKNQRLTIEIALMQLASISSIDLDKKKSLDL